jgi:hypothetical protein|tara:strand:+ start:1198 stop:1599 length:402 start_codon:yes stop_codon:yes gene_type:complete
MNKLRILALLITFQSSVSAQIINVVEGEWDADFTVFFTSLEWNADVIVCRAKSAHHAQNMNGYWSLTEQRLERNDDWMNIYIVDKAAFADIKVFFTDDESKINTNALYKTKLNKRRKRKRRDQETDTLSLKSD